MTTWGKIKDFPDYEISTDGQVMSFKGGKPHLLKQWISDKGYCMVGLSRNGIEYNKRVHVLMAETFIGPATPQKPLVLHYDDNKLNNNLYNLEYGTFSENAHDAVRNGKHFEASRPACDQGHEFTPENTMRRKTKNGDVRKCKECHRITTARYRAKKKES